MTKWDALNQWLEGQRSTPTQARIHTCWSKVGQPEISRQKRGTLKLSEQQNQTRKKKSRSQCAQNKSQEEAQEGTQETWSGGAATRQKGKCDSTRQYPGCRYSCRVALQTCRSVGGAPRRCAVDTCRNSLAFSRMYRVTFIRGGFPRGVWWPLWVRRVSFAWVLVSSCASSSGDDSVPLQCLRLLQRSRRRNSLAS